MLEITWLGHSTFQLRLESGETVLIDPWLEGKPTTPAGFQVERLDTILVSHGHGDHTGDVIKLSQRFQPKLVAVVELAGFFESKGCPNTIGMNRGGFSQVGGIGVTLTDARHTSSIQDGEKTVYAGEPCGIILHLPDGRNAYFAGDTSVFGDMALLKELYQPQIAFLPIGDFYTMGPKQAALAAKLVGAPHLIPMHYGTFPVLTGTPEAFRKELGGLATQVHSPAPGETIRL